MCSVSLTHVPSFTLFLCGLVPCVVGCTGRPEWQSDVQPVQGTLTINGEAAKGAVVTLYPTGESFDIRKSKPWGVTDEAGVYRLRTYEKDDGAPLGEYKVTFVWQENPSVMGSPDQLRGAYSSLAKSEWTFTIDEETSQLPPIEVTGAKVSSAPKRRSRKPTPFDDAG
ncbi:hypothetical protein [Bremerella alba]|uniref:Carboxypeptidase regulatory-like domain-containing protein n=1 Tax=Bremerella alba TaxID=980252 RepID=A0A7V8V8H2_9BACT|nr:hypothetical protein [Bremerella alba]MBA2116591.1 hypothetical protein [Bremerella alba]